MPNYALVNIDQLEADLTAVADKIRAKGGTTGQFAFPSGYEAAVDAISTGVTVQRKSGTFTTGSNGKATVTCGFQPDFVYISKGEKEDGYYYSACLPFVEESRGSISAAMWSVSGDGVFEITGSRSTNGFTVSVLLWPYDDMNAGANYRGNFNYKAVKYT